MTPARRQRLLLGLLAFVALLGAWNWLPVLVAEEPLPAVASPTERERPTRSARAAHAGSSALDLEQVDELRLDRLDVEPIEFQVGRDPFRYGAAPAPPPPPPPTAAELAALEASRRLAAERAQQAAIEEAKPRPPAIDLVYLGSFGPSGRRVAVFSDKAKQEILNARRGEVLRGKFILDEIGLESVSLKFVGFPEVPAQRLGIGG